MLFSVFKLRYDFTIYVNLVNMNRKAPQYKFPKEQEILRKKSTVKRRSFVLSVL